MTAVRPQLQFDDLYTAVYDLIDDAKSRHSVIKLYKGSHASADPHPVVLEYGKFFAAYRRGVLGYACHTVNPRADRYKTTELDEFDRRAEPRVSTRRVFTLLARTARRTGETPDAYLNYLATRRHRLGAYRGASSGYDDESRAFAATYFQQLGLPVQMSEIAIFCGGFKGALICTCAAVMSLRRHDELCHTGGLILAPVGYYQSVRLIPAIFGGTIEAVALPTSRVAFATTTSAAMHGALAHYRTVFSFGRVPQTGELSSVAALCLTPQTWIDGWNAEYCRRLTVLNAALDAINQELGCQVYQAPRPEGGWYFALRMARHLFPADVASAVHACAVLLHYGQGRRDSGVTLLPGELFGHGLSSPE